MATCSWAGCLDKLLWSVLSETSYRKRVFHLFRCFISLPWLQRPLNFRNSWFGSLSLIYVVCVLDLWSSLYVPWLFSGIGLHGCCTVHLPHHRPEFLQLILAGCHIIWTVTNHLYRHLCSSLNCDSECTTRTISRRSLAVPVAATKRCPNTCHTLTWLTAIMFAEPSGYSDRRA